MRDILSEFGPESSQPQVPRATSGGVKEAKPLPYDPPKSGQCDQHQIGPGLHGAVYPQGTQK